VQELLLDLRQSSQRARCEMDDSPKGDQSGECESMEFAGADDTDGKPRG
jgi:hypothetical protein